MMRFSLLIAAILFYSGSIAQVSYTANERVNAYNGAYLYGVNNGHYNTWDDRTKGDIAAGNPLLNVKGAGVKTFHQPLPESFLETWGYGIRYNEFSHYASLGMKDHTIFLEGPSAAHKDNNKYGGCLEESKLFKNLYEPIWDGGANGTPYNDNNYYAAYVYKTVNTYKAFTKFWEVINEPDMGTKTHEPKGTPGNWWENAPLPCDLSHIKAPIFHYIRMLRITYDVVKTLDPSAYVGPGGVGTGAFLDAMLRYTDNPVDGSVTAAYPAKGGAYFDALTFHFYPIYTLKYWENGVFKYKRHSDAAVTDYVNHKIYLENIVKARGYDGITYPKKIVVCSENGMPRKAFGEFAGSDEIQRNFTVKADIESQKNDVRQYYMFILGDFADEATASNEFEVMGFYKNLNNKGPIGGPGYQQQYTNSGIAHKTTSDFLMGFRYDAAKTAAMSLPANIGGGAFYNAGEYRYVLWAKTTTDFSESAAASYTFPAATNVSASLKRREWNFFQTATVTDISSQNISLNGSPSYFQESTVVLPPQAPVAQAGADLVITLPVATVNLDGTKSTATGSSITNYNWSFVSGPAGSTITTPAGNTTSVTGLVQGSYVFRLKITNAAGTTATDDVSVTVNAAIPPSALPVANAGKDETLPVGQASVLHGETSTATAGIKTYAWTKFSGPAQYEMLTPSANATWIRNMVVGVYTFRLTITDNNGSSASDDVIITVGSGTTPPNQLPVAKAGNDINITLPANSVTVNNAGSTDADGTISSFRWSYVSGPSGSVISTPSSASSTINNLVQGIYTFRLTVTDNAGGTSSDDMLVTVANAPLPGGITANAGKDETLPVGQATVLHGESSTAVAGIKSFAWSKISGPAQYEMLSPSANATWIRNMVAGVYTFRLTVTDNNGASGYDDVMITVGSGTTPVNQVPVARAGNDLMITLPVNTVTLSNAGSSDADGTISSFQWSYVSGPAGSMISAPGSASTAVNNLAAGVYTFRLQVTDNAGAIASDDVLVTVANTPTPGNITANAGKDETLPVGQATVLHGEASTAVAGIKSFAWSKVSGPAQYEMLSPAANATWVRNMVAGVYTFRLTVTDNNGASAYDDVILTVGSGTTPANQPPVARAGSDITVTLPTNAVTLSNAGSSDADGIISSFRWTYISGPTGSIITTPTSASTIINNLVTGVYIFRFTVTDNGGATATDDVVVTVLNVPLTGSITANAGKDETLPVGQATVIHGETSTAAAGIKSFAWTKYAGPAQFEMLSPAANATWIRNMVAGTYVFRLTVTDNNGASGYDDVVITVLPTSGIAGSGALLPEITQGSTALQGQSLVVYPNPVITTANFKWTSIYTGDAIINIVDASGVIVKRMRVSKQQTQFIYSIDVSVLKQGMYIVEVRMQDGKSIIEKMFKK